MVTCPTTWLIENVRTRGARVCRVDRVDGLRSRAKISGSNSKWSRYAYMLSLPPSSSPLLSFIGSSLPTTYYLLLSPYNRAPSLLLLFFCQSTSGCQTRQILWNYSTVSLPSFASFSSISVPCSFWLIFLIYDRQKVNLNGITRWKFPLNIIQL